MHIPVHMLGHVVLNVRNLARSVPFYEQALCLRVVGHGDEEVKALLGEMAFLSFGEKHHDLALREIVDLGESMRAVGEIPGLAHVAFRIGSSLNDLREMLARLETLRCSDIRTANHGRTCSVYFRDPDGLLIECYVGDDSLSASTNLYVASSGKLELG